MSQQTLNLQVETLSQREQWLVERLQGYCDMDLEIEGCKTALLSSPEPPSTTIRGPEEDDPYVVARYKEPLQKEWQIEIAATIQKHVPARWKYVTVERVHNTLCQTYSDDVDEDNAIQDAADITRRDFEERTELTPIERVVIQHEAMLEEVRERLRMLEHQKRVIQTALGQMEKHYPTWYDLLWRRYVQNEKYITFLMSTGMTEKFYRNERHRALSKFDKLAIGLR